MNIGGRQRHDIDSGVVRPDDISRVNALGDRIDLAKVIGRTIVASDHLVPRKRGHGRGDTGYIE